MYITRCTVVMVKSCKARVQRLAAQSRLLGTQVFDERPHGIDPPWMDGRTDMVARQLLPRPLPSAVHELAASSVIRLTRATGDGLAGWGFCSWAFSYCSANSQDAVMMRDSGITAGGGERIKQGTWAKRYGYGKTFQVL